MRKPTKVGRAVLWADRITGELELGAWDMVPPAPVLHEDPQRPTHPEPVHAGQHALAIFDRSHVDDDLLR